MLELLTHKRRAHELTYPFSRSCATHHPPRNPLPPVTHTAPLLVSAAIFLSCLRFSATCFWCRRLKAIQKRPVRGGPDDVVTNQQRRGSLWFVIMMYFAREFDAIAQGKGHSMLNEVLDVQLVRSELASSCLSALHQPR